MEKTLLLILDKIENLELNEQNEIDELNKKRIRLEEMEYKILGFVEYAGFHRATILITVWMFLIEHLQERITNN